MPVASSITPESVFRVKNVSDEPLSITWDSRTYTVPPAQERFLPFAVVAHAFGDPRAASSVAASTYTDPYTRYPTWISDRASEVKRLRTLYGGTFKGDQRSFKGIDDEGNEYRLPHPQVEVYDTDGNPVPTVLDDPTGDQAAAAAGLIDVTTTSVPDQIAHLQKQLNALLLAQNQNPPASVQQSQPTPDLEDTTHEPFTPSDEPGHARAKLDVSPDAAITDLPTDDEER